MGNDVEGDLLGELLRLHRIADEDRAALLEQLVHAHLPGAGDGLVGGNHHPPDLGCIVQRLQGHHQLRRGAVGVRDDVLLQIAVDRIRVHFGHDQRHIGVHAVIGAVVDYHAAGSGGRGRIVLRSARSGREQGDVPSGEVEMLDVLALHHPAGVADLDLRASRARAGDRRHFVHRELALGQDREHLAPHIARRAYNNNPIAHCSAPARPLPGRNSAEKEKGAPAFRPGRPW